jgi:hypothetical protein
LILPNIFPDFHNFVTLLLHSFGIIGHDHEIMTWYDMICMYMLLLFIYLFFIYLLIITKE